jgi:hypothetical protein
MARKGETKGQATAKRAMHDAWTAQARAEFPEGTVVDVGTDFLREDFTKVDLPDGLVGCWAPEEETLAHLKWVKADPQPANHEMVLRKQTLWIMPRDLYEAQKAAERSYFNVRHNEATAGMHDAPEERDEAVENIALGSRAKASFAEP